MKSIHFLFSSGLFILLCGSTPSEKQSVYDPSQPNIIVFLVDDMGWMDTSVPFGDSSMPLNKQFHTPNMERLAREGMVFTRAYTQPVCTPSRSSLLTGMHPARMHITNWVNTLPNTGTDHPDSLVQCPDWNIQGLSPVITEHAFTAVPLPEQLRSAGYHTIHVGKAHWGSQGTPGADPLNMGFVTQVAGSSIGNPQSFYGKDNFGHIAGRTTAWAVDGLQEFHGKDIYLTEALTRKALELLKYPIAEQKPFFLHFAHYAVHTPLQPDPRYIGKYLANGLDSIEAAYASMVEGMDKSLGDIMDFLDKRKIADNTVIVFLSDNGGLSAVGRGGRPNLHNRPLRSGKGSPYEGGIRIPMIVKWTGHVKQGSRNKTPVGMEDISPTLLAMANARPSLQKTDGNNLVPLLEGKPKGIEEKTILIHYPHRWTVPEEDGIAWTSAFISGKWKLVYRMKKKKLELYDLEADMSELHDLSDTSPEEMKRMALQMGNALRNCNAQMPVWKETGKQVSWPDELMEK